MMQQAFPEFYAALHASGKSFNVLLGSIVKADADENFSYSGLEGCAVQAVEMTLVPQIFIGGQLGVNALGLEDYPDLAAEAGGIPSGVVSVNDGAAGGGDH